MMWDNSDQINPIALRKAKILAFLSAIGLRRCATDVFLLSIFFSTVFQSYHQSVYLSSSLKIGAGPLELGKREKTGDNGSIRKHFSLKFQGS